MKLSKAERAALKQKFDGRCAYCGCELGDRWHADHVRPVTRLSEWVAGSIVLVSSLATIDDPSWVAYLVKIVRAVKDVLPG